jgi:hypothetical protein
MAAYLVITLFKTGFSLVPVRKGLLLTPTTVHPYCAEEHQVDQAISYILYSFLHHRKIAKQGFIIH